MKSDPIGEAVAAVAKRRKWGYKPPEQKFTEDKPRLYNPPRSSNDNRKRTGPNRRSAPAARGIIEIRIFDDRQKEPYQGCVRIISGGPSDFIVYLRSKYVNARRGEGRGNGRTVWYIASVQGAVLGEDSDAG